MSQAPDYSERCIAADTPVADMLAKQGIGILDRQFTAKAGAARTTRLDRGREGRGVVGLIRLLRRGGFALVLLALVLLVAPAIDCGLLRADAHTHASTFPVGGTGQATVHGHSPDDAVSDYVDDHCGAHIAHCVIKSLLPGTASTVLPLQLLGLMLSAALIVLTAVLSLPVGGVRAPPGRPVPAHGREILTRLCIARR
ncbi:hypothetical protein [Nocardia sp. CY41]|uniref:hypothetical protein n=1 Tax=Nocardia sp. CY41 TaxID=2608686 RepID=UPI001357AAE6|nr:hypothetical protein [Nocardia sp. CY41]